MNMLPMFVKLILLWLAIFAEKVVTSKESNRKDLPSLHCHADQAMKEYYHQNKTAWKEMQLFEIKTRKFISTRKTSKSYVIPVVFHVYGTDFSGHLVNDGTIIKALEKLNDDFHGLNADFNTVHPAFQGYRSTLDVTFKLARKDPNGNPTTGIIYYPVKNGYATDNFNNDVQREAWDNYKYCNIYIQSDIHANGVLASSGVAWYPDSGMSDAKLARIVYNGRYLYGNTDNEFSSVLTHEFGHWLNLIHTFEDGCRSSFENQCVDTGDRVCDTPPTEGSQGCGAASNCLGKLVNSENYMDYSGAFGCYKMFTAGQVARMEAAMQHPARITLWQYENLIATGLVDDNTGTNSCSPNPCNNGGSCYKYRSDFVCVCTSEYAGLTCDMIKTTTTPTSTTSSSTMPCANQPCQNGGTCFNVGNSYFCYCGTGSNYTGKNCESPIMPTG